MAHRIYEVTSQKVVVFLIGLMSVCAVSAEGIGNQVCPANTTGNETMLAQGLVAEYCSERCYLTMLYIILGLLLLLSAAIIFAVLYRNRYLDYKTVLHVVKADNNTVKYFLLRDKATRQNWLHLKPWGRDLGLGLGLDETLP